MVLVLPQDPGSLLLWGFPPPASVGVGAQTQLSPVCGFAVAPSLSLEQRRELAGCCAVLCWQPFPLALPEPRPQAGIPPCVWAAALVLLTAPGLSLVWIRCLLENPAPPDRRGQADPPTAAARGHQSPLGRARGLWLVSGGEQGWAQPLLQGCGCCSLRERLWLSPLPAAKLSGASASFLHRSTHGGRKVPCRASSALGGFEGERCQAPQALLACCHTVPEAYRVRHVSSGDYLFPWTSRGLDTVCGAQLQEAERGDDLLGWGCLGYNGAIWRSPSTPGCLLATPDLPPLPWPSCRHRS